MAEIKDFDSLFRLDGKVALITGGELKGSSVGSFFIDLLVLCV